MAKNHMPTQTASQQPTQPSQPSHPANNAFDSPPSYAHANATAQLPPIQTQGKNNGDTYHNNIILPPIPAVESLSLEDRPARTHSGSMSYSTQHSNSNSNSQQNLALLSSQSLPLPQPVEPPEPIQPRYQPPPSWPSSNPFVSYYRGPEAQQQSQTTLHDAQSQKSLNKNASPGVDSPGSVMDVDRERGSSALSIDDPDVRMAAEALGDLRADFVQTPPNSHRNGKWQSSSSRRSQPEPLLSLLTSHPLIGPAVNQSAAAYSASKNYSPAFKCTAEYVERRVTPVVNRVSTVGRVTGVEGGVRWFLGGRRRHNRPRGNTSASNADEQGSKRRKMRDEPEGSSSRNSYASTYSYASASQLEPHASGRDRRDSQASSMVDSLPAYDDFTSPSYAESQVHQRQGDTQMVTREDYRDDPQNLDDSSWQRKFILSTSGLSIAMSDESLRSLRYCLTWLRWAGEHIGRVVAVLSGLLEQQERNPDEEAGMNRRVQELKADVLKTLKDVVEIVSKYAGGALPENAKLLVRRHLTSLPARFKIAQEQSQSQEGSAEGSPRTSTDGTTSPREGARRATLLAKEGIEMMNQVSGILDLTIVSAEEWRQKLGKNGDLKEPIVDSPMQGQQPNQQQSMPNLRQTDYNGDFRMGEAM